MTTRVLVVVLLVTLGCGLEARAPAEHLDVPPLVMTLNVVPDGNLLRARVVVDHVGDLRSAVRLGWTLPGGVAMTAGKAEETLEGTTGRIVREYGFQVRGVPSGAMLVRAEAGAEHWGVVAQQRYEFGRGAHAAPGIRRSPKSIPWRGIEMGHGIPLDSKPVETR